MKALIVDDHFESAEALAKLIRVCWKLPDVLEIVIVGTMADGLREAPSANVTVLDLDLPDSDPDATIGRIPAFRPPVIVVTGHHDETMSVRCMQAGATHVFVKGGLLGFVPQFFSALQKDLIRRADERGST